MENNNWQNIINELDRVYHQDQHECLEMVNDLMSSIQLFVDEHFNKKVDQKQELIRFMEVEKYSIEERIHFLREILSYYLHQDLFERCVVIQELIAFYINNVNKDYTENENDVFKWHLKYSSICRIYFDDLYRKVDKC